METKMYPRITKAYFILAVQLLITTLVVKYFRNNSKARQTAHKWMLAPIILSFALIFLMHSAKSPVVKFIMFTVFSICIGMLCLATSSRVSDASIQSSLKATGGLFIAMSVIGLMCYYSGIDLSKLELILVVSLIGLILGMIFAPASKHRVVFIIGVIIFSMFIAVDTWNVFRTREYTDSTTDALSLYLSLVNLFQQFLGLKSGE